MRWSMLCLLVGCAVEVDEQVVCPEPQLAVVRTMRFSRIVDGRSDGFDLDGEASTGSDGTGCNQADVLSPEGTLGVDNALASLLPLLELTEARVVEELMQLAIDSGELLILLELPADDAPASCSNFRVLRADDLPLIGTDGKLLAGQTLALDVGVADLPVVPASEGPDGLQARDFQFELPIQVFDADLHFVFDSSAVRIDPPVPGEEGPLTGIIGGGAAWEPVVEQLDQTGIATEVKQILRSAVGQIADLSPDEGGVCRSMSAAFTFEAVEAFVYDDLPLPADSVVDVP